MFYESLRCGVVISQSNTSFLTKENTHPSSDTLAMSVSSIPSTVFFPLFCFPFQDFGESRFPSSGQNLYPVKKFSVFPNPVLHFGQIPVPENTLQEPVLSHTRKACPEGFDLAVYPKCLTWKLYITA